MEGEWRPIPGAENQPMLLPLVDVLFGNEEDFTAALGYEVEGLDSNHQNLDAASLRK